MATGNWRAMEERWPKERPTILRLFAEPEGFDKSDELSPASTLTELWHRHVLPNVVAPHNPRPGTVKAYNESLKYWVQATSDPPLYAIDDSTCGAFSNAVKLLPGRNPNEPIADNTVRKHCGNIQFILDKAAPRTKANRKGLGLLDSVPYLERPVLVEREPDDLTLEEIELVLAACDVATRPRIPGVATGDYWRALYVFDMNVGVRLRTMMLTTYPMIDQMVDNWYKPPLAIIKGKRVRKYRVNAFARAAIESIRTDREYVFPWPDAAHHWPYSEGRFHIQRKAILKASGLPPHRWLGFHSIRKHCATALAQINPVAAQTQLGHEKMSTTIKSYMHARVTAQAVDQLPQPKLPPTKPPQP